MAGAQLAGKAQFAIIGTFVPADIRTSQGRGRTLRDSHRGVPRWPWSERPEDLAVTHEPDGTTARSPTRSRHTACSTRPETWACRSSRCSGSAPMEQAVGNRWTAIFGKAAPPGSARLPAHARDGCGAHRPPDCTPEIHPRLHASAEPATPPRTAQLCHRPAASAAVTRTGARAGSAHRGGWDIRARIVDASQRNVATIAGVGCHGIIVFGICAEFFVRSSLVEPGDAGATAGNIRDAEGLFRIGLAGDLVMPTFDAIVAAALHVLLRPLSAGLALLATFFRLVHAAVYGVTLLTLFLVLQVPGAPAREWSRLPGRPRRQRAGCARAVVRRGAQVTDGSSRCSSSACTS